jgi:hypothetical protein
VVYIVTGERPELDSSLKESKLTLPEYEW